MNSNVARTAVEPNQANVERCKRTLVRIREELIRETQQANFQPMGLVAVFAAYRGSKALKHTIESLTNGILIPDGTLKNVSPVRFLNSKLPLSAWRGQYGSYQTWENPENSWKRFESQFGSTLEDCATTLHPEIATTAHQDMLERQGWISWLYYLGFHKDKLPGHNICRAVVQYAGEQPILGGSPQHQLNDANLAFAQSLPTDFLTWQQEVEMAIWDEERQIACIPNRTDANGKPYQVPMCWFSHIEDVHRASIACIDWLLSQIQDDIERLRSLFSIVSDLFESKNELERQLKITINAVISGPEVSKPELAKMRELQARTWEAYIAACDAVRDGSLMSLFPHIDGPLPEVFREDIEGDRIGPTLQYPTLTNGYLGVIDTILRCSIWDDIDDVINKGIAGYGTQFHQKWPFLLNHIKGPSPVEALNEIRKAITLAADIPTITETPVLTANWPDESQSKPAGEAGPLREAVAVDESNDTPPIPDEMSDGELKDLLNTACDVLPLMKREIVRHLWEAKHRVSFESLKEYCRHNEVTDAAIKRHLEDIKRIWLDKIDEYPLLVTLSIDYSVKGKEAKLTKPKLQKPKCQSNK